MPTEQTEHGFSPNARVISLDPEATEAAVELVEQFLAQREQGNALFEGEFREDVYKQAVALTAAINTLVTDYRFHRPTQWAYEAACRAIEKHRQRADEAEAELTALKASLERQWSFRYDDGFGIEEREGYYDTEGDARIAAEHHQYDGHSGPHTIVTRLASEWQAVSDEEA